MDKPIFIISIDTELLWGPEDKILFEFIKRKGKDIRKTISKILTLLERYKIPATWAVVGHLFLEKCEKDSCLTTINTNKFKHRNEYYVDPHTNINRDPLFYGKDIIEKILSNFEKNEIGFHSFSHPLFNEISREMAQNEIKEAKKIEKKWNIKLKSFVFPSNKIAHVDILKENGFRIYRGKTAGLYDPSKNLINRKIRGSINKIIAPPVEPIWVDNIWEIQSSMYFSDPQIPQSILFRGKLGLKRAIRNKKVFHIWFHPWNLLVYKRLESDLEKFLKYVSKKRAENKITVMTMGELAGYMNSEKRGSHDRF